MQTASNTEKEKILNLLNSKPKNMIVFAPNVATWAQIGLIATKNALEELVSEGLIEALKVPKYRNEMMSQHAVGVDEEFDWENMQDPDDFYPLTSHDIEISYGFRLK